MVKVLLEAGAGSGQVIFKYILLTIKKKKKTSL